MKNLIYTLFTFLFLIMLTSAINNFDNKTLVVPPTNKVLELPDVVDNYQVIIPDALQEESNFWWLGSDLLNDLDNDKATLGRVLFYDDRLSGDNSLSCGSCHKQEFSFADSVAFSDGIDGSLTLRNSMVLNDLGWQIANTFFWDFRTEDIELAVLEPIEAAHELGKDIPTLIAKLEAASEYPSLFEAAYGNDEITPEKIAESLSHFIFSMSSFESKYDQGIMNNYADFNASELSGKDLFETNCGSSCHFKPHFGSNEYNILTLLPAGTNGLDSELTDLGWGAITGSSSNDGVFKSPTLRNIEVSAPYMHDGRFKTLEEVIDFYSEDVQFHENSSFNYLIGEDFTGFDFTDEEKEDLLNFMLTFTDDNLLTNPKWSDPWKLVINTTTPELASIKVYPNPVSDMVIVELDNPQQENYDIDIYDTSGKLINHFQTSETMVEVPRNNNPAGAYKLVASNGKEQKVFKLIYQ